MSDYAFVTRWSFQAPVEAVWQLLSEPEALARPLFAWNHDIVVGWGAAGLARRLGCAVRVESSE